MKVDKLTKLENDIFRMQDIIEGSKKKLEVLQQRYTQCRNDRFIEMITKTEISVDEMEQILREYERKKNAKEDLNETEYIQTEEVL